MEIKTITLQTENGGIEYVAQLGNTIFDRVGRKIGFKATKTSPNYISMNQINNWIEREL